MSDTQIKRSGFIGATIGNAWEGLRDAVSGVKPTRSKMMEYDQPLLWVSIVLLGLGLVMVYSASIALPDSPKYANYTNGHFLIRHAFSLLIGVIGAVVAFQIPVKFWDKYAPKLFIIALVLLVVVLIPHVGKGVNGARRWLPLGIMNFQPSELMKLAVVLYAANYTVRKQDWMQSVRKGFLPMGVAVAFVGSLLLLEPDMGAFLVIAAVAMGILFLGGVNGKLFGGLVLTAVSTFSLLILMSPWRRERIFAYLNPWQEEYAQGKAYQLTHSLIAFGRGEWTGVGPGWQHREAALPARSPYRLHPGRDRRGAGLHRCADRDSAVLLDGAPCLRDRPHRAAARPHLLRPGGQGPGHLDRLAGLHQHGREPGPAADQGADAADGQLRRLGHPDELHGDRAAAAHRL